MTTWTILIVVGIILQVAGYAMAPAAEGVQRFLEIMDDSANYPVLIHCFAGIHRSGAFTAIYRMEYEHWSNQQAIDETIASGYTNLEYENDILGFLTDYRPRWKAEADPPVWATWKKAVLRSAKAGKRKAKTPGD